MVDEGDRAVMLSLEREYKNQVLVEGLIDAEERRLHARVVDRVERAYPGSNVFDVSANPYKIWVSDVAGAELALFIAQVLREEGFTVFVNIPREKMKTLS